MQRSTTAEDEPMETCKVFENESDVDIDVKAMSILKRMLQEVSTECQHLQMSPRRLARSLTNLASLHEFKIADNHCLQY